MAEIGNQVSTAARWLRAGDVVAIPTETVYGLAGNALDPAAVAKIFAVKNRPSFNPLIVHTDTVDKIRPYVRHLPEVAELLAKQLWPGPLTLLLPKTSLVPDIVTAGLDRVAVRIPNHPLTLALLAQLDFPLAAPSANPFGYVSPTRAAHVAEQLGEKIPYILNGGACSVGIESTIVGWEDEKLIVYRWGGTSAEQLQSAVGQRITVGYRTERPDAPPAPGMTRSHYAPRQTVVVGDIPELLTRYPSDKVAIISFRRDYPEMSKNRQVVLSPAGDLVEAAQQLFASLRRLEKLPVDYILAEWVPNHGLGQAINDRLTRAATERQ